jgi:hypothetical protein
MFAPADEEQTETKCIVRVNEQDHFYIGIDQAKRRVVVHIAASPSQTNFARRWILIMTEVAKLDIEKDAPIDVIFDYTEAKPIQPNLKVIMFTKAVVAGMLFPNVRTWRVVPGDPTKSGFLQKFSRQMSSNWLPMRTSEKVFQSVEEAEGYLDEFRAKEAKDIIRSTRRRLKQLVKDRSDVGLFVSRWDKSDLASWKDRTINSLTYAQFRIRRLCKAYLKGEITLDELKKELPSILNSRDRGERNINA